MWTFLKKFAAAPATGGCTCEFVGLPLFEFLLLGFKGRTKSLNISKNFGCVSRRRRAPLACYSQSQCWQILVSGMPCLWLSRVPMLLLRIVARKSQSLAFCVWAGYTAPTTAQEKKVGVLSKRLRGNIFEHLSGSGKLWEELLISEEWLWQMTE